MFFNVSSSSCVFLARDPKLHVERRMILLAYRVTTFNVSDRAPTLVSPWRTFLVLTGDLLHDHDTRTSE